VNSDAHTTDELDRMEFGIVQLRRAWLTAADLINTQPLGRFLRSLRPRP
jgi:DNA polymerase (family 10)